MAQRTTTTAVQTVLGRNYDSAIGLQQCVDWATLITDRLATCATSQGDTLSAAELEMIERYLAAHNYTTIDPLYTSRSTSKASGSFYRGPKNDQSYKAMAVTLDPSGCLASILDGQQVGRLTWGGLPVSEQTPYDQRD